MEDTINTLQPCENLEATVGKTVGTNKGRTARSTGRNDSENSTAQRCPEKEIPVIFSPNRLVLTRGIADTFENKLEELFERIRTFDAFTPDNDPWEEHDFGSFEFCGKKVFWKIDDYDGEQGLQLVFTILLADEY